MESLFAEFKKQSEGVARQDQELQLQIVNLEETNHQLSNENENLLRRVQTLERLKKKQTTIVNKLNDFHRAVTSTVVSPTSTPVSVIQSQKNVSESLVTTNEDTNWETVSTDEYIPFESSTKRPQKYYFEHLVNLTDTTDMHRSNGVHCDNRAGAAPTKSDCTANSQAQCTKLTGEDDVAQRARANAARREHVRNRCWFFQLGRCAYGDICNKSHDVVPFRYCAAFNTDGKCSETGCKGIHELFEYKKPILSESERQALLRAVYLEKRK